MQKQKQSSHHQGANGVDLRYRHAQGHLVVPRTIVCSHHLLPWGNYALWIRSSYWNKLNPKSKQQMTTATLTDSFSSPMHSWTYLERHEVHQRNITISRFTLYASWVKYIQTLITPYEKADIILPCIRRVRLWWIRIKECVHLCYRHLHLWYLNFISVGCGQVVYSLESIHSKKWRLHIPHTFAIIAIDIIVTFNWVYDILTFFPGRRFFTGLLLAARIVARMVAMAMSSAAGNFITGICSLSRVEMDISVGRFQILFASREWPYVCRW